MKLAIACVAASLALGGSVAAQPHDLTPVPEPPPIPDQMRSGEAIEPDVTIIQREEETVVEYRVNGQLRAIKVIPENENFPPYYLMDTDGDGRLESRSYELAPEILVNSWILFSW